jgi:Protein of unknown function (DUF3303)
MLFMVIESFKKGNAAAVGERFRARGRMLPDGVNYQASWVDPGGTRCFQLMEAAGREALSEWTRRWADLIDFEIVAVEPSVEFWAKRPRIGPEVSAI